MNNQLLQTINANPTLKNYCSLLKQTGFEVLYVTKESDCLIIIAQKDGVHHHDLHIKIDPSYTHALLTITSQLFWTDYSKIKLPGHDIDLEIKGEYDDNYNYDHDFTLKAIKTKSNVTPQKLVKTIDSMLKEIENSYYALIK